MNRLYSDSFAQMMYFSNPLASSEQIYPYNNLNIMNQFMFSPPKINSNQDKCGNSETFFPLQSNMNYYQPFGFPNMNMQTERKRSFPSLNQINHNYPLFTDKEPFQISHYPNEVGKNYLSCNNLTKFRAKKKNSNSSCSTKKASTDSTSNKKNNLFMPNNNKIEIKINHYEIDEFKSYLNSIQGDVCDFLCSQKGSREMHKTLVKLPQECKTLLINKLGTKLTNVMIDIYGNYFCQQLIQTSVKEQIILMLNYITNSFVTIAKDYSGTHVLQAILDMITTKEEEAIILSSISNYELEMAYDNNATHVLQKIIVTIPEERRTDLNQIIMNHLKILSLNPNGICLVKKFIGNCTDKTQKNQILKIFSKNCVEISQSPYGNYAIQYILDEWGVEECASIVKSIIDNICTLSIQKYSSNVSEKIIELLDENKKALCFKQLFFNSKILVVIKNKYGRYVLQKAIKMMNDRQKCEIKNKLVNLDVSSMKEKNRIKFFLSFLEG